MSSMTQTLMISLAALNVAVLVLFALVELRERRGRRPATTQSPVRPVAPEPQAAAVVATAEPEPVEAPPAAAAVPDATALDDPALPDLLADLIRGVELEETKSRAGSGQRWKNYLEVGRNLPDAARSRRPGATAGH